MDVRVVALRKEGGVVLKLTSILQPKGILRTLFPVPRF
jgi:hypothetical protein